MRKDWYQKYKDYLNSQTWREKRKEYLTKGSTCEHCGGKARLTLHHKNYKNLYNETKEDFVILCWKCHKKFHKGVRKVRKTTSRKALKKQEQLRRKIEKAIKREEKFSCTKRYSKNYYFWGRPVYK